MVSQMPEVLLLATLVPLLPAFIAEPMKIFIGIPVSIGITVASQSYKWVKGAVVFRPELRNWQSEVEAACWKMAPIMGSIWIMSKGLRWVVSLLIVWGEHIALFIFLVMQELPILELMFMQVFMQVYHLDPIYTSGIFIPWASCSYSARCLLCISSCYFNLDSYFYVVINYGSEIGQWQKLGYDKNPNRETFGKLLEAPELDIQQLVADRVPVPKIIKCDQDGSQARFLLA